MQTFLHFCQLAEVSTFPLSVPKGRPPLTVVVDRDVLDHHPIYRVMAGAEKVGYAKLSGDGRSVMDVTITPRWQRQGIAAALYDFIEQHRKMTLRPSPMSQTPAGKAFWAARQRRQGMNEATKLWKYNKRTGYWDLQRSIASPSDEQTWLKTFQDDDPTEHFVLSKTRPSKKPTLREAPSDAAQVTALLATKAMTDMQRRTIQRTLAANDPVRVRQALAWLQKQPNAVSAADTATFDRLWKARPLFTPKSQRPGESTEAAYRRYAQTLTQYYRTHFGGPRVWTDALMNRYLDAATQDRPRIRFQGTTYPLTTGMDEREFVWAVLHHGDA